MLRRRRSGQSARPSACARRLRASGPCRPGFDQSKRTPRRRGAPPACVVRAWSLVGFLVASLVLALAAARQRAAARLAAGDFAGVAVALAPSEARFRRPAPRAYRVAGAPALRPAAV